MRALLIVILGLALLVVGWIDYMVQPIVSGDPTGIVWIVAGVTVGGTVATFVDRSWLTWVVDHGVTLMLGLLGTVVGFMAAVSGAVSGDDVQKMTGITTALTTTIAGMISHLFLIVLHKVSER